VPKREEQVAPVGGINPGEKFLRGGETPDSSSKRKTQVPSTSLTAKAESSKEAAGPEGRGRNCAPSASGDEEARQKKGFS